MLITVGLSNTESVDFPIPVNPDGQRRATKKAGIAIFEHDAPHTPETCVVG